MLPEALDPTHISFLNWNIAKGKHSGWEQDFQLLCQGVDIAVLQEAKLEYDMPSLFGENCCWTFAPGFTMPDHSTGVMTLSRSKTISQSKLSHREPWTRLPKAALVSEYNLQGFDFTLLVANVHAINFTPGVRSFKRQLYSILDELLQHSGPIIFAGDFNTWRRKRLAIVGDIIQTLGLAPIHFATDHRKQAFGLALDHIFVRGLERKSANVQAVFSSDHNPMKVTLGLIPKLARQTPMSLTTAAMMGEL